MTKKISVFLLVTILLTAIPLTEPQQTKIYHIDILLPGEA